MHRKGARGAMIGVIVFLTIAGRLESRPEAVPGPRIPDDDAEVLAELPAANRDPALRRAIAVRRERMALPPAAVPDPQAAADPAVGDGLRAATRLIRIAREDGDPRALGQAQSLLAAIGEPTAAADQGRWLLLQAMVAQGNHRFDEAIALVDRLLQMRPQDPQALLLKTSVLQVRGQLDAADRTCAQFGRALPGLLADACAADLASLRGDPLAHGRLERIAAAAPSGSGAGRDADAWLHTLMAEMADRAGDAPATERHYRSAVAGGGGVYAIAGYADWLIDAQRPDDAIALLEREIAGRADAPDALLLPLAIAYRRLSDGQPTSGRGVTVVRQLRERFAEAAARGATLHARERAAFALAVDDEAARALDLARINWRLQREPADARLYARAAIAAGDAAALATLREDLAAAGLRDRRLGLLLADAALPRPAGSATDRPSTPLPEQAR